VPFTICFFGSDPTSALLTLIALQVAEVLYATGQEIFVDKKCLVLRMVENGLFVVVEFVLLVMLECDRIASANVFKAIGYFLSAIALLVLANATLRTAYLLRKKYQQLTLQGRDDGYGLKKPQTQHIV
jgi:hypothetical protein